MPLFLFPSAAERDPEVEAWLAAPDPIRQLARPWFEALRAAGPDVRELMHDGHPTACAGEAAFAYVAAFTAHAAVGFYFGAELPDPHRLLEGAGKRMRHVKIRWGQPIDEPALQALITAAYADIRDRL
ncbi:DUF1801 domain-containing protein [Caulobacter sp. NIBR1757]|uniref:DUF1801 domain-containing protein n=1 Tax=Caulobacter sp. NIBR1757 TaxID=3016000 RepID=UPI0022EFE8AD|nr:DUF1801 domain-containing protein [Caulobacter sp. NIBR1757]WGM39500.1 hypothetical protein AMEJIAPC_02423 [Caulobacter sp. NIBR1757]